MNKKKEGESSNFNSANNSEDNQDDIVKGDLEESQDNSVENTEDKNQTIPENKINFKKDDLPTLEQIEQEILAFCVIQKSVTSREVQNKFKKYKLTANTIKSILKDFEAKSLGTVSEKQVGGKVSFRFTSNDTSDVSPDTPDVD